MPAFSIAVSATSTQLGVQYVGRPLTCVNGCIASVALAALIGAHGFRNLRTLPGNLVSLRIVGNVWREDVRIAAPILGKSPSTLRRI
jgi:hypothetical protein